MRSPILQRVIDDMKKDSWWVKFKREIKLRWWVFLCVTRKYWDIEFINRRNSITHWTIRKGSVLKVFPAERSHVRKAYKVIVIESNKQGFTTHLNNPLKRGHKREFIYESNDWKTYHHNRFQIVKY
jgi:hypothetical protein